MLLQLHDGPMSQPAPGIILPDALLVDNRDILQSAIDEALPIIKKELEKRSKNGMAWVDVVIQVALFLISNWDSVTKLFKSFSKTIDLVQYNNNQRARFERNEYNVQQLNEMSASAIKNQMDVIALDMTTATAEERPNDVAELSRFYQVYQMRLAQLPKFDWAKIGLIAAGLWVAKKIFA